MLLVPALASILPPVLEGDLTNVAQEINKSGPITACQICSCSQSLRHTGTPSVLGYTKTYIVNSSMGSPAIAQP